MIKTIHICVTMRLEHMLKNLPISDSKINKNRRAYVTSYKICISTSILNFEMRDCKL